MDKYLAVEEVRSYVNGLIENANRIIEECKVRHESCEEAQEYLDMLQTIEDALWHMV